MAVEKTNPDQFLWVEKYRPNKVEDCIVPADTRKVVNGFIESGALPHLMLSGTHGTGKTTLARAMCEELGYSYMFINGSEEGRFIDTLRNKIKNFASTASLRGKGTKKAVILDEADYLPADTVQPALRSFMEEMAGNCIFIFTCNLPNRIIKPLHSRCSQIEFKAQGENNESMTMMSEMFTRVCEILEHEGTDYDRETVAKLIKRLFPDFRKTLQELQRYSVTGKIDSGIFASSGQDSIEDVIKMLRDDDFKGLREWVAKTPGVDLPSVSRDLYDNASKLADKSNIPQLVLILADYQYRDAFVSDHEINLMAMFTQIMLDVV